MTHKTKFLLARIFGLIAAAFLFGCAPMNSGATNTTTAVNRMAALSAASNSTAAVTDGSWSCPDDPNVTLKDNIGLGGWDFTGNEDFTVCVPTATSSAAATSFKISGTTMSHAVCIYPMHSGGAGAPMMAATPQCYSITGAPIQATFSGAQATINYFVIVDANYTDAMNACLSSTSPCPAHSEGFVQ